MITLRDVELWRYGAFGRLSGPGAGPPLMEGDIVVGDGIVTVGVDRREGSSGSSAGVVGWIRDGLTSDPDRVSLTFIEYGTDGEPIEHAVSRGELDLRARAAAVAIGRIAAAGDRVGLLLPHTADHLVGYLGALYAGTGPVLLAPPDLRQTDRLLAAGLDADPTCALVTFDGRSAVAELAGRPGATPAGAELGAGGRRDRSGRCP